MQTGRFYSPDTVSAKKNGGKVLAESLPDTWTLNLDPDRRGWTVQSLSSIYPLFLEQLLAPAGRMNARMFQRERRAEISICRYFCSGSLSFILYPLSFPTTTTTTTTTPVAARPQLPGPRQRMKRSENESPIIILILLFS